MYTIFILCIGFCMGYYYTPIRNEIMKIIEIRNRLKDNE